MKKLLVIAWLTVLCFLMIANVHAWEVPSYIRVLSGTRMWFSVVEGDLVQADRTKLGIKENLGLKQDKLVWEWFGSVRVENIHVFRLRTEFQTSYDQARNESYQKFGNVRLGYDLDFYMTPQLLLGANADLDILTLDSRVSNVVVGGAVYNYSQTSTNVMPALGVHGSFYPILEGISLRPNLSGRVNYWSYYGNSCWDWEAAAGVDVPINQLWTWQMNGGYRMWNTKVKRERDEADITRGGVFIESAVLF
ncbi:MAG: hypothetical protein V2B18_19650 [Pseudomonadota bacterium]